MRRSLSTQFNSRPRDFASESGPPGGRVASSITVPCTWVSSGPCGVRLDSTFPRCLDVARPSEPLFGRQWLQRCCPESQADSRAITRPQIMRYHIANSKTGTRSILGMRLSNCFDSIAVSVTHSRHIIKVYKVLCVLHFAKSNVFFISIFFVYILTTLNYRLSTTNLLVLFSQNCILIMAEHSQVFKGRHLHEPFPPALAKVSERSIERLSVEFLETGGSKPHVVFHLTISDRRGLHPPEYKGVRIEMDWR